MKKTFEESLKLPKILMLLGGIRIFSKTDDLGNSYNLKSWMFYLNLIWLNSAIFCETYWVIEQISYYTEQSLDQLCATVPCLTICLLATIKINCLYCNKDVLENIIDKLRTIHPKDNEEGLDENEKQIVYSSMKFLNRVSIFFCCACVPVVIGFGTAPALSMAYDYVHVGNTELKVPFNMKYFFEITTQIRWSLAYVHQVGAMIIAAIQLLSADIVFYVFCGYLQMHFQLLCIRFENFVSKHSQVATRSNFRHAVRRHQELIELVEQIELLYSKSTLCNIILSSLLICLCGFVVTFVQDICAVSTFLAFLVMNLTQISLLCYFGDLLSSASIQVSQAVYNSLWYDAELRIKKSVLIVITRAQKPCKITAMKFADLDLNALSAILRTSWSYFAVLKTLFE